MCVNCIDYLGYITIYFSIFVIILHLILKNKQQHFKQKHYIYLFEYKIEFYIMLKNTLYFGLLYSYLLSCLGGSVYPHGSLPDIPRVKHSPWKLRRKFSSSPIFILAWERDSVRTRDGAIKIVCFRMRHRLMKTGRVYPPTHMLHLRLAWSYVPLSLNISYAISRERCYSAGKRCQPNVLRLKSDEPSFFSLVVKLCEREIFDLSINNWYQRVIRYHWLVDRSKGDVSEKYLIRGSNAKS